MGRWGIYPLGEGPDGPSIHPVQYTELRDSTNAPSLRYPLASSSHKWICQLMFQGPEQQMISSSKAKDKENKSLDFCWEKPKKRKRHFLSYKQHRVGVREQTLSSQFLLRSASSIVWPCWPLYPTKACTKKKYWPNGTQAKLGFFSCSKSPLPMQKLGVFPFQQEHINLCGQIHCPAGRGKGVK